MRHERRLRIGFLCALPLVGFLASAGSIAFVWWAWPRLPPVPAVRATFGEKCLDVALLGLLVLNGCIFSAPPVRRRLHFALAGCERAVQSLIRGALLVLLAFLWVPWGEPGLTSNVALLWLARAAFVLGISLHLLAAAAVGNGVLLGFDGLRRRVEGRAPLPLWLQDRFVSSGPWALSRHPLALALIVVIVSGAFFQKDRLLVAAGGVAWLLAMAWAEERHLARIGGQNYRNYRARTGFLLPRQPRSADRPLAPDAASPTAPPVIPRSPRPPRASGS